MTFNDHDPPLRHASEQDYLVWDRCRLPVSGACALLEQVLVDGADGHRALPGGAGHALDRTVAHVPGGEYARQAGLERQRRTLQWPRRPGKVATGQDEPTIIQLQDLLHSRWNENLSLQELSTLINIHPVTISKYFPRYFSCTLGEYIRKVKVEKAVDLIKQEQMSLTALAYHCGFFDQSHFIRAFKTYTGFRPKEYQQL